MRLGRLTASCALVAGLAAPMEAQPRPAPIPPPAGRTPPATEGLEIAAGSMIVGIFPAIGGQVSVPIRGRARLEGGAQVVPWLLEDGEDLAVVPQIQVRLPFRDGPPGSRRSLLLGVTGFVLGDRLDSLRRWEYSAALRPHAGVSWQWQKSPSVDLRIDLQAVVTGDSTVFVVPFATFSMVWHRERRSS